MKPHRGTLVLVFGILGIVSCWPLGLAAWLMGRKDLKEMDAGTMDPSGRGNTNAGRICGMIGTLLASAIILLMIVFAAVTYFSGFGPAEQMPTRGPAPQMQRAMPADTNTATDKPAQRP